MHRGKPFLPNVSSGRWDCSCSTKSCFLANGLSALFRGHWGKSPPITGIHRRRPSVAHCQSEARGKTDKTTRWPAYRVTIHRTISPSHRSLSPAVRCGRLTPEGHSSETRQARRANLQLMPRASAISAKHFTTGCWTGNNMAGIVRTMLMPEELQDAQKGLYLTRPAPVCQDALFHGQGCSERRGEEVHTKLRLNRSLRSHASG